eukprot:6428132-Amphidinium_carterae.1
MVQFCEPRREALEDWKEVSCARERCLRGCCRVCETFTRLRCWRRAVVYCGQASIRASIKSQDGSVSGLRVGKRRTAYNGGR